MADAEAIKKKLAELKKQEQELSENIKEFKQTAIDAKKDEQAVEKAKKAAKVLVDEMDKAVKDAADDVKILNDISKGLDKISK